MNHLVLFGVFLFFVFCIFGLLTLFWFRIKPLSRFVPLLRTVFFVFIFVFICLNVFVGYKILTLSPEHSSQKNQTSLNF
ncbi:hypothetical protein CSB09_02065 [Candidatus Gracilibacteria bacterium]|nr:MAG: hypothetical protein CSB09_02065 [Candidatus Gracilibacteria bacterium]